VAKVSIIIPVHNRAGELPETLDSIRAQTSDDWEAVIVDDHSTDGALDVARRYEREDARFRSIQLPDPKRGAPAARNFGVQNASGEFVIFLDSDDLLSPNAVEVRLRFIEAKPELDFAIFKLQLFRKTPGDIPHLWNADTGEGDLLRFLKGDSPWGTASAIWRRSSLTKIRQPFESTDTTELWDEQALSGQDWEFHIRALASGLTFDRLDQINAYWRMHDVGRNAIGLSAKQIEHINARPALLARVAQFLQSGNQLDETGRRHLAAQFFHAAEAQAKQVSRAKARQTWIEAYRLKLISWPQLKKGLQYFRVLRWKSIAHAYHKEIAARWPELILRRGKFYNRAPIDPKHVPEISVILSAYNVAPYIERAVESILSQTWRDLEFIIIDDGSTDETGSILERIAETDCRVRLIRRENKGLTVSLNEAIGLSRAPFIARMDGDDIAHFERLRTQMKYMKEHPECVLLGTRVLIIDPFGVPIVEGEELIGHEKIDEQLLKGRGGSVVHPTALMRRDALEQVGRYREQFNNSEDLDLFLRLTEIGRVENLPDVLMQYRRHLSSVNYLKFENQQKIKKQIVEEAFARRGKSMPADWSLSTWTPTQGAQQLREWAWNAMKKNRPDIARIHAWQALKLEPFKRTNISLMIRALRAKRGAK